MPFLSITAVIVCALLANLFIVLPHVQPASLSLAFQFLILPSAFLTFLFLVLLRAVDPGVLRPSSSPPTPRTAALLASHHNWYIAPKRYARQHIHADGVASHTPLLSQPNPTTTQPKTEPPTHHTHTTAADDDEHDGELVVQQWCFGCQLWRPPHAGHCRHCEVCIERFDHHCFVLGACVGRHNLLFFMLFLLAAGVSGVVLTSSSLIMLLQRGPFTGASASEPLVWLGLMLTGSSLYICATLVFLAYHVHLLCTNTTTREQHRHHQQPTSPPHHATPAHTTSPYNQLRARWHDVVWPPGRRWKQAWVVDERSERRRVMEKRWRREGAERTAEQQWYQEQQDAVGKDDSEGSVSSRERLWKGEEGDEEEVKERVVSDGEDEQEEEGETAMSVSSFLSGDDG